LNKGEVKRIFTVKVEFGESKRNTKGEGIFLEFIDIEARRHKDQMGLDTPVVYAVKDEYCILCKLFSV